VAHALSEEESNAGVGAFTENSTLDGISRPKNDDFDRVAAKVRLHNSKKAVTVFPEEAVQIARQTAQYRVADKVKELLSSGERKKTK
jgi:hypothetical protein